MATPTPYLGRTRPTGSDQAIAGGAVTENRIALANGVDSQGRRRVIQAAASGVGANPAPAVGVFQASGVAGDRVELANGYGCVVLVEAGGIVAADTDVTYDATGRVVAAAPAAGANAFICGRSINASGAAGDLISIYWLPGFKQGQ
jgi:hypothetical protein